MWQYTSKTKTNTAEHDSNKTVKGTTKNPSVSARTEWDHNQILMSLKESA